MDQMSAGRVALISGGARGIGRAVGIRLAEEGWSVAFCYRTSTAAAAETASAIEQTGRRALPVACHVGEWGQVEQLAERAYAEFGKVDILVNNAGMSPAVPSHEVTEQLFDSVLGLNFKGPFRLASQVAHRMKQAGGGVIINVSSSGALMPLPGVVPYSGAKAALNAMTVSMAREYGPEVRVNTISAGPFLTDISKAWSPEARERADNALGRPGRPEEVVTTALYLASPMSSFTTGAIVRVDGGA